MRKLGFLITAMVITGVVSLPSSATALTSMTETQMRNATGQAGIVATMQDRTEFNTYVKTLAYGDDDGTDGRGAFLSMNDIEFKGSVTALNPVTTNITSEMDPYGNRMLTGLNIGMDGVVVEMEKLNIGSITVGDAPGQGNSFGSISIEGFRAEISGNIRITTHP